MVCSCETKAATSIKHNILSEIAFGQVHEISVRIAYAQISLINAHACISGADPGFLERGFISIKVWGFALLI